MKSGIYTITNTKNSKVYIGSTTNFQKRWANHRSRLYKDIHSNHHIQSAWNKYGANAFEFGILEYIDNPEELHLAEQFWMDIYQLGGRELYNHGTSARHPMLGTYHTEEHCRNIGRARLGKKHSKETCRKISEANKGKVVSEKTRHKMAEGKIKPYPSFINRDTGKVIPAGRNLAALCEERGLHHGNMVQVKNGKRRSCRGWTLQVDNNLK